MEGVMVGNSPVELRFLNPLIVFHSFFSWDYFDSWTPPYEGDRWEQSDLVGSILSIEINWNVMNNLAVYGQMVLNAIGLPWYDNPPPNSIGYLAGIQYAHVFDSWASIFFLEFIYTDPYLHILSTPFGSFIQQNHYSQYYYIGYPRDTLALTFGTRFFNADSLNFSGSFAWIASGEKNRNNTIIWDWQRSEEAFNLSSPSGTPEHQFILSLGAGWKVHPYLVLGANITGIFVVNNKHVDGDTAICGQAAFSVGFRY
jgi:hypothetical protein